MPDTLPQKLSLDPARGPSISRRYVKCTKCGASRELPVSVYAAAEVAFKFPSTHGCPEVQR